eukprot:40071_1
MMKRRRIKSSSAITSVTEQVDLHTDGPVAKKRRVDAQSSTAAKRRNSDIVPYDSIQLYFYNTVDQSSECNRRSLRHHMRDRIRISPSNSVKWCIEFVENTLRRSDQQQIKKLTENAFNKKYSKYCLETVNGDPMKFILLKDQKDQIISFLIYSRKRSGFLFVIKTVVTDTEYRGKGLGSMCILALQYMLIRKELYYTHKLYAEVALDAISFWNRKYLNMTQIKDKRRFIMDCKMKVVQEVCEYIWIVDIRKTERKLLEYLNKYHFVTP